MVENMLEILLSTKVTPNLHLNREVLSRSRCFEMRVMCFFYFHHQWLNYCSIPKTFFLLIVSQFSRKTFLQIYLDIQNQNWILLNQKCLLVFQLDPTMNFLLTRNSIFWKLNIKLILQKNCLIRKYGKEERGWQKHAQGQYTSRNLILFWN